MRIVAAVLAATTALAASAMTGSTAQPVTAPTTTTTTTTTTTVARVAPNSTQTPTSTTTTVAPSTTTTVALPLDGLHHPHWARLALDLGWPLEEIDTLDHVVNRESRGLADVHNAADPGKGSFGLMQINAYWCKPSRWTEVGWLQDKNILDTCHDLYQPETVLRASLAIYLYSYEKHGFDRRFGPWTTAHDI